MCDTKKLDKCTLNFVRLISEVYCYSLVKYFGRILPRELLSSSYLTSDSMSPIK